MRNIIMDDDICAAIKEACEDEVCDPRIATVSVERLEADLREVENECERQVDCCRTETYNTSQPWNEVKRYW